MPAGQPQLIASGTISGGSGTLVTTQDAPAGESIIVIIPNTDAASPEVTSLTDDAGNSYLQDFFLGAGGVTAAVAWSAHGIDLLPSGSDIDLTLTLTDAFQVYAYAVRGIQAPVRSSGAPYVSDFAGPTDPLTYHAGDLIYENDCGTEGWGEVLALAFWRISASGFAFPLSTFSWIDPDWGSDLDGIGPLADHFAAAWSRQPSAPNFGLSQIAVAAGAALSSYVLGTVFAYPARARDLAFERGVDGRLILAEVLNDGAFQVIRYDDAVPEGEAETVTVLPRGAPGALTTACALSVLKSAIWHAWPCANGVALYIDRTDDQGRVWHWASEWAGGLHPPYRVSVALDPSGTLLGAAVYRRPDADWVLIPYTLPGRNPLYTAFQPLASSASSGGDLLCRRDAVWLFAYCDLTDAVKLQQCRALKSDGTGAWTALGDVASGYRQVRLWQGTDFLAAALWRADADGAFGVWDLSVGVLNLARTDYDWTVPAVLSAVSSYDAGDLRMRGDSEWQFLFAPQAGGRTILSCRDLSNTGAGAWA